MAVDGLTKALLSNKFKEFIELVRVSKIEAGSNGETSNVKNNGNFVVNYYKEAGEEEISFKAEEAG